MMSPAFFDPIPPLLLFSNSWPPQTTSRPDKSFKFQARTRSLDQNFTKANFHGTKDWVCCWHCVRRVGGRPFEGVLANEAKQEKTKVAHSASLQQTIIHIVSTLHFVYNSAAIKTIVSKMLRSIFKSTDKFSNEREQG